MSEQERNFWTDPLTWGCNAGLFVFGMAMAILGTILPILFERVALEPSQAGSLFLLLNLGALIVTVGGGPASDRFGFRFQLAACSILTATALFWLARAESYESLATASFILGLGGGGLNVGTNALVSDLYPGRQSIVLNRIGVFFGFGTLLMPLLVGALLQSMGLELILSAAAIIAFLPALLFLTLPFPRSKQAGGVSLSQMFSILRNPYLLLLGLLLFFQSGNEITTSGWLTTFLVTNIGSTPDQASLYLSGFWGTFILGRLATSWLLKFVHPPRLVQVSAAFSAIAILVFATMPGTYESLVLACVLGFSIAPVFATVMGEASSRFPAYSGTVLGALLGMSLVGGILAPWITGVLVEEVGITKALALPFFGFLGVLVMQTLAEKRSGRGS
jgi:fucose permease